MGTTRNPQKAPHTGVRPGGLGLRIPGLEFENVATSESEFLQIRKRTADSTATAALNWGRARRLHRLGDFDRKAAATVAHDLESRSFAGGGKGLAH